MERIGLSLIFVNDKNVLVSRILWIILYQLWVFWTIFPAKMFIKSQCNSPLSSTQRFSYMFWNKKKCTLYLISWISFGIQTPIMEALLCLFRSFTGIVTLFSLQIQIKDNMLPSVFNKSGTMKKPFNTFDYELQIYFAPWQYCQAIMVYSEYHYLFHIQINQILRWN